MRSRRQSAGNREAGCRPEGPAAVTLGLIADTHDAPDPLAPIRALGRLPADLRVHLGDVASSPTVMALTREFKTRPDWWERLTPAQQARFTELIQAGRRDLSAYLAVRLGETPAAQARRRAETEAAYLAVLPLWRRLRRAWILAGNVDRLWESTPWFARWRSSVRYLTWPQARWLGAGLVVLWPSLPGLNEAGRRRLRAAVRRWARRAQRAAWVVILAHEPPFRGPTPARYLANLRAAGLQATTIPFYSGRNPTADCLLWFCRALPATLPVGLAFGHLHDPAPVIAAGTRFLRLREDGGLAFRLYGCGARPPGPGRRTIALFAVPAGAVATLRASAEGFLFRWETV